MFRVLISDNQFESAKKYFAERNIPGIPNVEMVSMYDYYDSELNTISVFFKSGLQAIAFAKHFGTTARIL